MKNFIYPITVVLFLFAVSGCSPAPDLNQPGAVSKTLVDEHGVVCYTTRFKGEFFCAKVK